PVQDLTAGWDHVAQQLGEAWEDTCIQTFNPIKGGPGSGNPDQARDERGRWTGGGSGGSSSCHHYPNHVPGGSVWESPCPSHTELECVQEKLTRLGKIGDALADLFLYMSEDQRKTFLNWVMAGAQPPIPDITTARFLCHPSSRCDALLDTFRSYDKRDESSLKITTRLPL